MLNKLKKDNKGFTIIEVLIVLAIAGLIMLIVFLAIPALQRNQRNNARNSDASRMSAAISECLANKNGSVDQTNGCGNKDNIAFGETTQLTTLDYMTTFAENGGDDGSAEYRFGTVCSSEGDKAENSGNTRDFVVLYSLEPDTVTRCIGSQSN